MAEPNENFKVLAADLVGVDDFSQVTEQNFNASLNKLDLTDKERRKTQRGFKKFKKVADKQDFTFEDGGFRVREDNTVNTKSGARTGNVEGFQASDLLGVGKNVGYLAGTLQKQKDINTDNRRLAQVENTDISGENIEFDTTGFDDEINAGVDPNAAGPPIPIKKAPVKPVTPKVIDERQLIIPPLPTPDVEITDGIDYDPVTPSDEPKIIPRLLGMTDIENSPLLSGIGEVLGRTQEEIETDRVKESTLKDIFLRGFDDKEKANKARFDAKLRKVQAEGGGSFDEANAKIVVKSDGTHIVINNGAGSAFENFLFNPQSGASIFAKVAQINKWKLPVNAQKLLGTGETAIAGQKTIGVGATRIGQGIKGLPAGGATIPTPAAKSVQAADLLKRTQTYISKVLSK